MAYEMRNNNGTLSRNQNKKKESHPDHRGKAMIDGKKYWISAWVKENQYGKYFSLAFELMEDQQDSPPASNPGIPTEDVPF